MEVQALWQLSEVLRRWWRALAPQWPRCCLEWVSAAAWHVGRLRKRWEDTAGPAGRSQGGLPYWQQGQMSWL